VNVLLVPAHPGFPGQIPQSRKTVVVVVVVVVTMTQAVNHHNRGYPVPTAGVISQWICESLTGHCGHACVIAPVSCAPGNLVGSWDVRCLRGYSIIESRFRFTVKLISESLGKSNAF